MNRKVLRSFVCAGVVALVTSGCGRGEDEAASAAHDPHAGGGALNELAEGIELFVEYPHQIQSVESEEPWEIYFTWMDGWRPVEGASVTLVMHGPRGTREEIVAQPEIPGVYLASPTLPPEGYWHVEFVLSVEGRDYMIEAGEVEVFASEEEIHEHAGHEHAGDEEMDDPHAGHSHAEDEQVDDREDEAGAGQLATGVITLSKEEQWSIPFAVAVAEEREIPASIPAAGELVAPPGGLVRVSAPVAGLVQVDGPDIGPGDFVRVGQLLALIAPISLDNSYARTRADVVAAQLEADRAERLFEAGAIPAWRVEESRRNLEVAVAAFEAIGGTLEHVDDDHAPTLYHLRSPIEGVIVKRDVALGEQVEIGEHAFTIIDATTLWFVAAVPARYAAEMNQVRGAWFTVEGGASTWTAGRLLSVGSMIDPLSRTLPVRFSVRNVGGTLKVGMLAEGRIQLGTPVRGIAVPTAAIQDENSLPVIYVKLTGDTFERRVVEVGASDESWTLVSSGIDSGEQVVTVGAYQVNLAALGVVAPAHDHAH